MISVIKFKDEAAGLAQNAYLIESYEVLKLKIPKLILKEKLFKKEILGECILTINLDNENVNFKLNKYKPKIIGCEQIQFEDILLDIIKDTERGSLEIFLNDPDIQFLLDELNDIINKFT